MNDTAPVSLTPGETRIVQGLRGIADSSLRYRFEELLVRLTDYVRDPRCAEIQADGVPCPTPDRDCHFCLKIDELIESIRGSMRQS
jgi:hypothetical protein